MLSSLVSIAWSGMGLAIAAGAGLDGEKRAHLDGTFSRCGCCLVGLIE